MLFSAGTFLYVATIHVLPEVVNRTHPRSSPEETNEPRSLHKCELLAVVGGACIPLFLTLGHHH